LTLKIVTIGDTWSTDTEKLLNSKLNSTHHSLNIQTASYSFDRLGELYNPDDNTLLLGLRSFLTAQQPNYVVLSVAAKDFIFLNYNNKTQDSIKTQIKANLETLLSDLKTRHPNAKFVLNPYEFFNLANCVWYSKAVFRTTITQTINTLHSSLNTWIQEVCADKTKVTFVSGTAGALQAAGNISSPPNVAYPSPSAYISADCIHPNQAGYQILVDKMHTVYWNSELSQ
jgi:lysophospholipase L1-like esterase